MTKDHEIDIGMKNKFVTLRLLFAFSRSRCGSYAKPAAGSLNTPSRGWERLRRTIQTRLRWSRSLSMTSTRSENSPMTPPDGTGRIRA